MWFLTVDPFTRVLVFIAKLSDRQYCWRVFKDFHCQEYIQFFDINCGLFMRLHFTIGCFHRRTTSRRRQRIHCSRIQVLFADHVHRRTGVYNKICFLCFTGLMAKIDTNFPQLKRMLFFASLKNFGHIFGRPPRCFAGTIALVILSLRETDPHILERWGYADDVHLGKSYPSDGFWSRMSAWRTTTSVNWTHRIGFSMFELFRKIDKNFGGSISWHTQPNCRVFFNIDTALLSPFF